MAMQALHLLLLIVKGKSPSAIADLHINRSLGGREYYKRIVSPTTLGPSLRTWKG
jgi:hypothetical protein